LAGNHLTPNVLVPPQVCNMYHNNRHNYTQLYTLTTPIYYTSNVLVPPQLMQAVKMGEERWGNGDKVCNMYRNNRHNYAQLYTIYCIYTHISYDAYIFDTGRGGEEPAGGAVGAAAAGGGGLYVRAGAGRCDMYIHILTTPIYSIHLGAAAQSRE
jgi:hypothetical protein